MGGMRQCANKETPHFTDDPFEMFCMECGLEFIVVEHPYREAADNNTIAGSGSEVGGTVSPTILQTGEAIVCFPWGEERFFERLAVGRDPEFSPIAAPLEAFPTVSGTHAEFRLRADGLVLIHVGRSNPTYVDGREIDRNVEVPISDGSRIHFSNQCECTVRVER